MHTRGGFLRHADDVRHHARPSGGIFGVDAAEQVLDDRFFGTVRGRINPAVAVFKFVPLVNEQGCVAAVIDDKLGALVINVGQRVIGAVPVFFEAHALPREHGGAACRNRRRSVVLGGENVAARPAYFGSELHQRFDQNRGLDGHVQRPCNANPLERALGCVAGTNGHQAGHFMLRDADFETTKIREGFVGDQKRGRRSAGLHAHRARPCLKRLPLAP